MLQEDIETIVSRLPDAAIEALANKSLVAPGGGGFLGRYFGAVFGELNRTKLKGREIQTTAVDCVFIDPHIGWTHTRNENICDYWEVRRPKYDYILFLAGIASPAHYRKKPLETIKIVTEGLVDTLDAATHDGSRLLFFSSSEIYGDPLLVPTPETYAGNVNCRGPRACYDESKRLGETLIDIYTKNYATDTVTVRPFNVYGPGMQPGDYRVMPNFAASFVRGEPLMVYGDGRQTRTYCYITDAMDGFMRALTVGRSGAVYNIGNPNDEISARALAEKFLRNEQRSGIIVRPHPDSYPAGEPSRRCPDISMAKYDLGYTPRVDIDNGIKKFLDWSTANYPH